MNGPEPSAYDQVTRTMVVQMEAEVRALKELVELGRNRVQPWVAWTMTSAGIALGWFVNWCLTHLPPT